MKKPELSKYSVILIKGKGRLIYKNFGPELKGIYRPECWKGMNIENSLIFTW